ncbi:uncharacterized protein LOC132555782 [Ylistrum balloti]|uniref:uncharacterized protein LOC132555782 n=1 Tax=Ylistrum balloti TaxID=509963 RepID=UPI002905D119|nr:uncharacterized protein LOC132555782 [Ylistrum balloti]
MATQDLGMDMITKRPRTPRDPYTTLTDIQIKNLKKDPQAYFMNSQGKNKPYPMTGWYRDRYAKDMNQHLVRGISKSQPYCYIDYQWNRSPPDLHNTVRHGAAERWGPDKVGMRTVQHFNGPEDNNRFVSTELYRRQPTNEPGFVSTTYGRPGNGYYLLRNPNTKTWFGSTVPLNRTGILESIQPKTVAEYEAIRKCEQESIAQRKGRYPVYSEYTDRFGLKTKIEPMMNTRQRVKTYIEESA